MDYKELLKKYIEWVGAREGINFISHNVGGYPEYDPKWHGPESSYGSFTKDEWDELVSVCKELYVDDEEPEQMVFTEGPITVNLEDMTITIDGLCSTDEAYCTLRGMFSGSREYGCGNLYKYQFPMNIFSGGHIIVHNPWTLIGVDNLYMRPEWIDAPDGENDKDTVYRMML